MYSKVIYSIYIFITATLLYSVDCFGQHLPGIRRTDGDSNSRRQPPISADPFSFPNAFQIQSRTNKTLNSKRTFVPGSGNNILSGDLDTCATYTYRLKIGNTANEESVNGTTIISSGDLLLSGESKNGTNTDALLIKMKTGGELIWSKTYGEINTNEDFLKARETSDGGIITIGSSNSDPVGDGWILICKLDNNGNLQWTRRYKSPSTGALVRGVDVVELTDNSFLFTGDNETSLFFGKLSAIGTLLWSKTAMPFPRVTAMRILEDYNGYFLAATGTENGLNVSCVFKVSLTDGSFLWNKKFGGAATNDQFIFHNVEMVNLRPRITGIYAAAGQPYKFVRITVNTGGNIETIEQYDVPGPAPDITAMSAGTSVSQAMIFSPTASATAITLVRNGPDVRSVDWSRSLSYATPFSLASIEKTADAGFLTATNMGGDIYLIKTDSIGMNPGCNVTTVTTPSSLITPDIPLVPFTISSSIWQETINMPAVINVTLNAEYSCKQLTCPSRPTEDTCLSTFYKTYRSYEFSEVANSISETNDDHILVGGMARSVGYEPITQKSFLAKMTKKGDLTAKYRFQVGTYTALYKSFKLKDGNTLLTGYCTDVAGQRAMFLTKIDNNLNVIWHKTYAITNSNPLEYVDVTESADGEIFLGLLYLDFGGLNDRFALSKFDNNGNILWQKTYRPSTGYSIFGYGGYLVVEGNSVFCCTSINVANKWITLVINFDKGSGNVSWSKTYTYNNAETNFTYGLKINNNGLYLSGMLSYLPNEYTPGLMRLSVNGNVEKAVVHRAPKFTFRHKFALTANGDIVSSEYIYNYNTNPAVINDFYLRMDKDFNIRNSKLLQAKNFATTNELLESSQGDIYLGGAVYYNDPYNADIFVKRFMPDGSMGSCGSDTFAFQQVAINPNVADVPLTQFGVSALQEQPSSFITEAFTLQQNQFFCGSVSGCDTIWLEGTKTICDTIQQYTFFARKNPGCTAAVNWVIKGAKAEVIEKSDLQLKIRMLGSGVLKIKSRLYTGCRWLEDSIDVQALIAPDTLNLGPDFDLCEKNTRILNAGKGYQNYQWQDGSSDSTFLVSKPGIYWVETTDACDNTHRDSVTINPAPPIPFDLGTDLTKCNNDSLTINAPSGFMNYTWSPAYNVTATTGSQIIIFPAIATTYSVIAEKTPGCFAYDSINITVKTSPAINLGNDRNFCFGDSIQLDAGNGFNSYMWNTGAVSSQITVNKTGLYIVRANAPNGCVSIDTMQVLNVYDNPVIDLGADSPVCEQESKKMDAGAGFSKYLWSTGSSAASITTGVAGLYWVMVTDNNNCKGSDTIVITGILPPPKNFLPKDTSLCSYSTLTINPRSSYDRYSWNNGSVSKNLIVSVPGLYWLQVTDADGCSGRDSIIINPKQCMEGFFIPSAFTPNKDGKNDFYKPLLLGMVSRYEFSIYNRWGELVFKTTDLQKGWDGRVSGTETDTNVFVWHCSFQFEGKAPEFKKGTVALIR